jgi:hypothetical protein
VGLPSVDEPGFRVADGRGVWVCLLNTHGQEDRVTSFFSVRSLTSARKRTLERELAST